jgi:hypothetical protein
LQRTIASIPYEISASFDARTAIVIALQRPRSQDTVSL